MTNSIQDLSQNPEIVKEFESLGVEFRGKDALLSQQDLASIFKVSVSAVSKALKKVEDTMPSDEFSATFSILEIVGQNNVSGQKKVIKYRTCILTHLSFILKNSDRAKAFRNWVCSKVKDLMTTGVAVEESILAKNKNRQQILDELWRKVSFTEAEINMMLDAVICDEDKYKYPKAMKNIYASITNRARVAATGMTAAQIKLARCAYDKKNLGMTVSCDNRPDPQTARNYLTDLELEMSTAVEQQFTLILRMRVKNKTKISLRELNDLIDNAISYSLAMHLDPVEAPRKGLADEAYEHVKTQKKMARLLASDDQLTFLD